jgi:hypothetical protein
MMIKSLAVGLTRLSFLALSLDYLVDYVTDQLSNEAIPHVAGVPVYIDDGPKGHTLLTREDFLHHCIVEAKILP